ncbi:O-antigen polysaccharide polymerase Wzy [Vibrio breoganii]
MQNVNKNTSYIIWFQIIFYFLVIPCAVCVYVFEYTPAVEVMPYCFVFILVYALSTNYFIGLHLNSTYSLFLVSFGVFIGGRYFAYLLDNSLLLFDMHFFISYNLNNIEAIELMSYLILGVCFLDIGYKSAMLSGKTFSNISIDHDWMRKFCILSLLLSPIFIVEMLMSLKGALSGGYLTSKLYQAQSYNFPLSSLAQTIFGIAFGYSMVFNYRKKVFIAILIYVMLSSLLIGARGPIITGMFLYIWMKGKNGEQKVGVIKILSLGLLAIVAISYFIQMYSFRANGEGFDIELGNYITHFIYEQGISVMVFDVSMKVDDYPILAYFQTFIPGASALASIFFPVEYYMTGFQHYMARALDPDLFNAGFGLDWTLFSDFYVFGGENLLGFCIVAFGFGALLAFLQNSTIHGFWLVLLFSLFTRLMFLPRSSLSTIFPFVIYFCVFVVLIPRLRFKS